MLRVLALLLVLACATADAEVFRRVGPDGEVYFSDTPGSGAERVHVGPAQSGRVPAAPPPRRTGVEQTSGSGAEDQQSIAPSYAQFNIVKPSNEQGVRANDGSVTIYLALRPALMPGHTIALHINGEDGEKIRTGDTLNFNLSNLSRGRHTVAARVINKQGQALIKTAPVSFYVLRVALGGQ